MKPVLIILCASIGISAVAVALGMLYKDWRNREAAWIEIQATRSRPGAPDAESILARHEQPVLFPIGLASGTLGVGLLAAATCGLIMRLRVLSGPPSTVQTGG